jgi:hypothetical protein
MRASWRFSAVAVLTLCAAPAIAQITPAPDRTPPDDMPSVRVGGTLFGDYTFVLAPRTSTPTAGHSPPTRSTSPARTST